MSSVVRYHIRHETVYTYGSDVVHSHQLLHLMPRTSPYQQCLEHSIVIAPAAYRRRDETDAFGNPVTRVEFEDAHRRLEVTAQMEMEVRPRPALCAQDTLPWEEVRQSLSYSGSRPVPEALDAGRYRHESPYVRIKRIFDEFSADCFSPDRPILECAQALMQKVHREFSYAPGETDIATPLADVLQTRRGVCQDFAHLMIACLRTRGLAARYVSGYIRLRPAVRAVDPESVQDGLISESTCAADDARDHWVGTGQSHAWVAVYIPPCGWLELDPTNDVRVGTDHIAVAWGRDFGDVSPLRGVILGGGTHTLSVGVTVEPQSGTGRVAN